MTNTSERTPLLVGDGAHHEECDCRGGTLHYQRQPSSLSTTSLSSCSSTRNDDVNTSLRQEKQSWKSLLLFGQVIALCSASTNASSFTMVYNIGVSTPLFQTCIMYSILSFHLVYQFVQQKQTSNDDGDKTNNRDQSSIIRENFSTLSSSSCRYTLPWTSLRLRLPWWNYFVLAFFEVESVYVVLLSFRYTTLTSTTLLLSLAAPSTMLFSRVALGRSYNSQHVWGVLLCLLCGTITVCLDRDATVVEEKHVLSDKMMGDLLAIIGALLYGLTDTVAEYAIKRIDRVEYLGMLGLFASVISGLQFPFVEWDNVVTLLIDTDPTEQINAFLIMTWYVVSLVAYYVCASFFLTRGDATLLNLSLQTSQLWAILFSIVADRLVPPPMFYVAVALMVVGVFVYELGGTSISNEKGSSATISISCDAPAEESKV